MGNTTRREPVTSKIPSSPDYKFLNITDFRGIHQTDNPFLAATNTASDCLNVYVDENNALTTRPRIEKILDASEHVGEVLYVYPLHEKLIYQSKHDGQVKFFIYKNKVFTEIINDLDESLPEEKCAVLENKDRIYIMTKNNYYVVTGTTPKLNEVKNHQDTYIPTVATNTITANGLGINAPNEAYNLLSKKYNIEYVWDMLSDSSPALKNSITYTNKGVAKVPFSKPLEGYLTTKYLSEKKYITYSSTQAVVWTFDTDGVIFDEVKKVASPEYFSPDGSMYVSVDRDDVGYTRRISVFNYGETTPIQTFNAATTTDGNIEQLYITNNGNSILMLVSGPGDDPETESKDTILLYFKNDSDVYVEKKITSKNYKFASDQGLSFFVSGSETEILVYPRGGGSENCIIFSDLREETVLSKEIKIPAFSKTETYYNKFNISKDLLSVFIHTDGKIYYSSFDDSEKYVEKIFNGGSTASFINNDKNILIYDTEYRNGYKIILKGIDLTTRKEYEIYQESKNGTTSAIIVYPDGSVHVDDKIWFLNPTTKPSLVVTYETTENDFEYGFPNVIRFQNNWWFYGNKNLIYWTVNNEPTYLSIDTKKILGSDEEPIVDAVLADSSTLALFKKEKWFITTTTTIDNITTEIFIETKSRVGAVGRAGIVSPYKEIPLYVNENGIYGLSQLENVQSSDQVSQMISSYIEPMFRKTEEKDKVFSSAYLYWTYFFIPHADNTDVYVLDDRTLSWYFWNLPKQITSSWYENETLYLVDDNGALYKFASSDIVNEYITEYYDDGEKIIPWYWRSQIMSMGTINYSKKLNTTTFIMTDTDETDEYGLNYKFKIFRKLANESNTTTITNKLNYILSVTKKTIIPRFNFLQFELSNIDEDKSNNKLRLIGLGLKYELLAGLM